MRPSPSPRVLPLLVVVACDDDITLPVGVHEGDVSWADVDSLCEGWRELSIEGNLLLQGSDPGGHTDLQDLSCVTSVSEGVSIGGGNLTLTSLDGLEQLRSAEGVFIVSAEALESAEALSGLRSVGSDPLQGGLIFLWNPRLTRLPTLDSLTTVSMLSFGDNDALENLAGMASIETVQHQLYLHDNASLWDISSLHGITSVGERIQITQHPCLASADAEALVTLIGTDQIDGEILLSDNEGPC